MNNQSNASQYGYEAMLQQQQQLQQNTAFSPYEPLQIFQAPLDQSMFPTDPASMPTPSSQPWTINAMPWPLASYTDERPVGLMHFTANNPFPIQRRTYVCSKRRADTMEPFISKQFITEERITEHFNGLHISSDYIENSNAIQPNMDGSMATTTTGKCFTNLTYEDYQMTAKELAEKLKKATRITVCDEMKQMSDDSIHKPASIIPETLLNRVDTQCKALVLWSPPAAPIVQLRAHNNNQNENNINDDEIEEMDAQEKQELRNMIDAQYLDNDDY